VVVLRFGAAPYFRTCGIYVNAASPPPSPVLS
jgi:hypothetical protein